MTGIISGIFLAPDAGAPMIEQKCVSLFAGYGIEGDRYALRKGSWKQTPESIIAGGPVHSPKRMASFISYDAIRQANTGRELHDWFTAADTRRNFVTDGIDLEMLIGREFTVASVRFRGVEPATPCDRPSALSGKPFFSKAFPVEGCRCGLLAEVLSDGLVAMFDRIEAVR